MTDELEIRKENPNSRPNINLSTDEQKLLYETVAQNQNPKQSRKTFNQSLHLNCQLLIKTNNLLSNCHTIKLPLPFWFTFNFIISNTIDLLKQTWFPVAGKERKIESQLAN